MSDPCEPLAAWANNRQRHLIAEAGHLRVIAGDATAPAVLVTWAATRRVVLLDEANQLREGLGMPPVAGGQPNA